MGELEVSVMSGISDVSGVDAGPQQENKDNDEKKKLVPLIACCLCLLGTAALLAALSRTAGNLGDIETTEGDESYIPAGPSSGGSVQPSKNTPNAHPTQISSKVDTKPTTTSSTVPTTTKKTPKPLQQQPLLCNIKLNMHPGFAYPSDGLCDFLFLTMGMKAGELYYGGSFSSTKHGDQVLAEFQQQAAMSHVTNFGLNFYSHFAEDSLPVLKTKHGRDILRKLWGSKITHYSILDTILFENSFTLYVTVVIAVFKILRDTRDEYKELYKGKNSFLFMGVAPLYDRSGGRTDQINSYFAILVRDVKPDAVLFRTSLTDEGLIGGYFISAPSKWTNPGYIEERATFEHQFMLRSDNTWPSATREFLSFTPVLIRFVQGDENAKTDIGLNCFSADFYDHITRCDPNSGDGALLMTPDGLEEYRINATVFSGTTYETEETMKKKMCKAAVEHNFTGGWAMLSIEYSVRDGSACNDSNYKGNFQLLQALRDFMKLTFTSC